MLALVGAALVFVTGFAQPDLVHNAAHDLRHAFATPVTEPPDKGRMRRALIAALIAGFAACLVGDGGGGGGRRR